MKYLGCCAFAVAFVLSAASAQAQATRTWVSGVGDDVNPCSRTAPCKTFAGAISKTFVNGEINCIDPGGFGPVTITKSITIDCEHVKGSILASCTAGIIVNINPSANDPFRSVRIRGLSINGAGASGSVGTRTGIDGIRVLQASSVFVDDTVISEFSQEGIEVAVSGAPINVVLDGVEIQDCGGVGVRLSMTGLAAALVATLNGVRVYGCGVGLESVGTTRILVKDSIFAFGNTGVQTIGSVGHIVGDDISIMRNAVGVAASPASSIWLSDSNIINHTTSAISPGGGSIISLQGNAVTLNNGTETFPSTIAKK